MAAAGQALKKLCIDMASTFRLKIFRKHLGMYLLGFGAEWLFISTFTYFIIAAISGVSWRCSKCAHAVR